MIYITEQNRKKIKEATTVKFKIAPNKAQEEMIRTASIEYIKQINILVAEMVEAKKPTSKTTKHIQAPLNSNVKNQLIRDAKSVFKKAEKEQFEKTPILKKPVIIYNNKNYKYYENAIRVPFMINGKSKQVMIKANITEYERQKLKSATKIGAMRITNKNGKFIAQIAIENEVAPKVSTKVMGVDLGIKVPSVCVTDENEVKFVGNGRYNKYVRRYYNQRRKELGKAKKLNAVRNSNNKEQRWLQDQDHKISRNIIIFAVENNVGIIRLEKLANIRKQTRKSRKNNHSLSNWSFYRLSSYIEYKASLVGIRVEYVDPKYTSQKCPRCGEKNKAKDRKYICNHCNYIAHRDVIGAKNIIKAPILNGKS